MSRFVDDPSLLRPVFEPRFAVRRLIKARGGVYDPRLTDDAQTDPPPASMLDSLAATRNALDPLVIALIVAGYDPRYLIVATSDFGDPAVQALGYFKASLRSDVGVGFAGNWPDVTHIVDTGAWYSVVAVRVLGWRTMTDPDVAPVALTGVTGYQPYRDPADADGTDDDGWIVLGDAQGRKSSEIASTDAPAVAREVIAAVQAVGAGGVPEPGLVRIFNPGNWDFPLRREASSTALQVAADAIWELRLRDLADLQGFVGASDPDADGKVVVALDDPSNRFGELVNQVMGNDSPVTRGDVTDELERRRRVLEPLEGSLPSVIGALWNTHWLLAIMQLHEYGLIDVIPLPAPTPAAIPIIDLTGFYTSLPDAAGDNIATLQVNQAGDEFRGYWVDEQMEIWPVAGVYNREAAAAGRFEWAITSTFDGSTGVLWVAPRPTTDATIFGVDVIWQGSSLTWSTVRRDRRSRVSPADIVARLGATPISSTLEPLMLPLHNSHAGRITALVDRLVDQINVVSDISGDAATGALAMDGSVVNLAITSDLADRLNDGSFRVTPLLVRLRVEVPNRLASRPIVEAGGVDGWNQLRKIIADYPDDTTGLQALFDIGTGTEGIHLAHHYTFTIGGGGLGAEGGALYGGSAGGFYITSEFTHVAGCDGAPHQQPNWSDQYFGGLGTVGGWVGTKAGGDLVFAFVDLGTNDLFIVDEWLRDDFLCWFVTGELSGGFGYYVGAGGDVGYEILEGYTFIRSRDGALASGRGGGWYIEGGTGVKAGASFDLVGMAGYYDYRLGGNGPPPIPPLPTTETMVVRGADTAVTYFAVDSAVLTEFGERMLKDLVLDYRPLFDSAGSYLVIEGDASRTGSSQHNIDLSRERVLAVYDYLHSLLTCPAIDGFAESSALAITDTHIIVTPHGESRPEWAKLPDEVEDTSWRRATVVVGGDYVASYVVAGVFVSPESQPVEVDAP